jgi:heme-degrading monooxygenase HmoA
MYARLTTGQIRPGKENEAIRLAWEVVLPVARDQPGYRGLISLFDWATGKYLVISLWGTEADRQAGETRGHVQEQLDAVMAGPTTGETFTVALREATPGSAAVARVLTARIKLATLGESVRIVGEAIQSNSRKQHGFRGALALVDRSAGKGYTISLWETEADRQAGEHNGYVREQLARVGAFLEGPVMRETFEVVVADLPP